MPADAAGTSGPKSSAEPNLATVRRRHRRDLALGAILGAVAVAAILGIPTFYAERPVSPSGASPPSAVVAWENWTAPYVGWNVSPYTSASVQSCYFGQAFGNATAPVPAGFNASTGVLSGALATNITNATHCRPRYGPEYTSGELYFTLGGPVFAAPRSGSTVVWIHLDLSIDWYARVHGYGPYPSTFANASFGLGVSADLVDLATDFAWTAGPESLLSNGSLLSGNETATSVSSRAYALPIPAVLSAGDRYRVEIEMYADVWGQAHGTGHTVSDLALASSKGVTRLAGVDVLPVA